MLCHWVFVFVCDEGAGSAAYTLSSVARRCGNEQGCGKWHVALFVTLRMESGEELPFFVDTGTTFTAVDKSLEPRLGKRLSTIKGQHYSEIIAGGVYSAPRI